MDTYPYYVTSITKDDKGNLWLHSTPTGFKDDKWICGETTRIPLSNLDFIHASNYLLDRPYKYELVFKKKPKLLRRKKKGKKCLRRSVLPSK